MYKHIFDRSNLDEVIGVARAEKDRGKFTTKVTRREDLAVTGMPRADIVLLNGTRSGKEYALYASGEDPATSDHHPKRIPGFKGDTWILDILSDEEFAQVQGIAQRMRQNAKDYPPAWKLLA